MRACRPSLARLAEDSVATRPEDARALTNALFREADRNGDGRIAFEEFEATVRRHPDVLEQVTRSEARWIGPWGSRQHNASAGWHGD